MVTSLYKKLYLYALLVLTISIILTSVFMSFLFEFNKTDLFREIFIKNSIFIRNEINKEFGNPIKMKERIDELSRYSKCSISYWVHGKLIYHTGRMPVNIVKEEIIRIENEYTYIEFVKKRFSPNILVYLDENIPQKGYLVLRFNQFSKHRPRPIFFTFFVLIFLAILLIPYTRYVFIPIKELIKSINRISEGDFTEKIDVSKYKDFKEIINSFNNMSSKIEDMINQKQRLIADVSHELRSPLTRIRLSLEILEKDPLGRKHYIEKIVTEIEQLDILIKNLLDVSKIELGSIKPEIKEVDFITLIFENLEKNELLLNSKDISVKPEFPNKSVKILADRNLVDIALNNIFSNLAKYSPQNSIVDVSLKTENKRAILSIRDRGLGVKEHEYEKIFEPFYRTDLSRSKETGGVGLGLSIVKKIMNSHNAEVWASAPKDEMGGLVINLAFECLS